ncbi:MAG: paraquat-inducible protein A [Pseudomonadota bacterium]
MSKANTQIHSFIPAVLILSATVCLILGITLPILKLTWLYIWTDTFSIISVIATLYKDNEIFLAAILAIFSIVLPFVKIMFLSIVELYVFKTPSKRIHVLSILDWLGKWSMLDVLILALMIFYTKSSGLAEATSLPGIYFFAMSVILTMVATALVRKLNRDTLS